MRTMFSDGLVLLSRLWFFACTAVLLLNFSSCDQSRSQYLDLSSENEQVGISEPGILAWEQNQKFTQQLNRLKVCGESLVLGGSDQNSSVGRWRVQKMTKLDGQLEWSVNADVTTLSDSITDLDCDPQSVYIFGTVGTSSFDRNWRMERRSLATGDHEWSFQLDGAQAGSSADLSAAVSIGDDGVYFAGREHTNDQLNWRLEKRDKQNGMPIWSRIQDLAVGGMPKAMVTDQTQVYTVGYRIGADNQTKWFVECRNKIIGELIWSAELAHNSAASSVTDDETHLYIVGSEEISGQSGMRIEKRSKLDGSIQWQMFENPTGFPESLKATAVDKLRLYSVGYSYDLSLRRVWYYEARDPSTGEKFQEWLPTGSLLENESIADAIAIDRKNIFLLGRQSLVSGFYDLIKWLK